MSTTFSILVEFKDGKPKIVTGQRRPRAYARPGNARLWRDCLFKWAQRTGQEPDIRILDVTIPDDGPVHGIWPGLRRQIVTEWS